MDTLEDEVQHLVPALLRDDREAFTELVHKLSEPLFGYSLSIVRNSELAQDVVQDTFVDLHKVFKKQDQVPTLRAFSFHIATQRAYKALKLAKNRLIRLSGLMLVEHNSVSIWIMKNAKSRSFRCFVSFHGEVQAIRFELPL